MSPDADVLAAFQKDYAFMMSEWQRLKDMSDQDFEFEKLQQFNAASKKYQDAMLTWVSLNSQLVRKILPEMKQRGNSVIANTIQSAKQSIKLMSQKRNTIALRLFTVSIITIAIQGRDEIAMLANIVNENTTITRATELWAKALHVERVSIWLFNDDKTLLTCADLYLSESDEHESGATLAIDDYPEYFKAIFNSKFLVVDNAREDPRTREFCGNYLEQNDIYSMLDLPIAQDDYLAGIICHKKTKTCKTWGTDEQDFASSVVHVVALSLEIKKRHQIQQQLLKAQEETLRHHAHHDILTNLPNRTLFHDRLKQAIKQAKRGDTKIAVLFIDLDHFKSINDSMGYKVDDELLIEVAKRLKRQIRQTDTLARLSGDEFVIVLDAISGNDVIVEITQNLLKNGCRYIQGHLYASPMPAADIEKRLKTPA